MLLKAFQLLGKVIKLMPTRFAKVLSFGKLFQGASRLTSAGLFSRAAFSTRWLQLGLVIRIPGIARNGRVMGLLASKIAASTKSWGIFKNFFKSRMSSVLKVFGNKDPSRTLRLTNVDVLTLSSGQTLNPVLIQSSGNVVRGASRLKKFLSFIKNVLLIEGGIFLLEEFLLDGDSDDKDLDTAIKALPPGSVLELSDTLRQGISVNEAVIPRSVSESINYDIYQAMRHDSADSDVAASSSTLLCMIDKFVAMIGKHGRSAGLSCHIINKLLNPELRSSSMALAEVVYGPNEDDQELMSEAFLAALRTSSDEYSLSISKEMIDEDSVIDGRFLLRTMTQSGTIPIHLLSDEIEDEDIETLEEVTQIAQTEFLADLSAHGFESVSSYSQFKDKSIIWDASGLNYSIQ